MRLPTLPAMKLLGVYFERNRLWTLLLLPVMLIAFLAGLFLLTTEGQARLELANVRVQQSDQREQLLAAYMNELVNAETAQRGYLITRNENDLLPYRKAVARIDPLLNEIRIAYRQDTAALEQVRQLRLATGMKMGELDSTLALARTRGPEAAMELLRTGAGQRYMDDLRNRVGALRDRESRERHAATEHWHSDLLLSRWITGAGAVLNVLLVLLAIGLVVSDLRLRSRQAAELVAQKRELESEVATRTQELAALSTHLQEISEQEKHAVSRELHDELGGLLVSARMDLSWLERKLPTDDPAVLSRFRRIQDSLTAGVNLKRRVVEDLRPTLLDNMGLFSALRWLVKEAATRSGLAISESYPEEELPLRPPAAIAIFRTVQEALTNILKHASATSFDVAVELVDGQLVLQVSDDGRGLSPDRLRSLGSHGLAAMRHRIESLGGKFSIANLSRGAVVSARVPLAAIVDPEREAQELLPAAPGA
ncbi:MAG: CHASE3 domain-containing protein [Steroidobacteraceae bacterium]